MKQDRFLTGILIGIGVLAVIALAVFFTRKDGQTYIADDTPEGVVHNYVLAVLNKDYEKAYGYLADIKDKPTYEEFRRPFLNGYVNPEKTAVDVGQSEIAGDEASVEVAQIYNSSDLFSSGYRDVQRAILVKQNGAQCGGHMSVPTSLAILMKMSSSDRRDTASGGKGLASQADGAA